MYCDTEADQFSLITPSGKDCVETEAGAIGDCTSTLTNVAFDLSPMADPLRLYLAAT